MTGPQTAVGYLRRGVSVEVVGPPGSGRTEFLDRTVALLEERGVAARRIHGIGGWRERAFGALAVCFPELSRQPSVGEAVALLERELAAKAVLVVDDADDLDDLSAGILEALRMRLPLPLLFGRRLGPRPSGPLRRLFASLVPVVRHTLRPLTFCDLQDVVEAELGGPVDGATMARIATKSGGLPGVARDIARVGKQTHSIAEVGAGWVASRGLWTSELGSSVDALLIDALPDDLDALTTLALAGPVRLSALPRLVLPASAERISELGLVKVVDGPGGDGIVGIFPPIVEEYLARESSTAKRFAVRELLRAEGIAVPSGLLSSARRSLTADTTILSRTLAEHWGAALESLLADWRAHPVPANGVALLSALLSTHGAPIDPAVIFGNTEVSQDQGSGAELAGWYAVHLALARGDWEAAQQVLKQAAQRYVDLEPYLRAVGHHLQLVVRGVPDDVEPAPAGAPVLAQDSAAGVLVETALAQGRPGAALEHLAGHDPVLPVYVRHAEISQGLALLMAGDAARGLSWAASRLEAAQRDYDAAAIQAHSYVAALGAAIRGDLVRLDELVSYTMTLTSVSTLHAQFRQGVEGLAAARDRWAASTLGSGGACPVLGGYGPYPFMALRVEPAERGSTGGALWELAASSAERGYLAAAAFALVEAAEAEADGDRFAVVAPQLAGLDSPFLEALVDLAGGMARRDAAALADAQGRLESFGAWLYVARAGIMRAAVLRAQGDVGAAAAQADRLWDLLAEAAPGTQCLFARFAWSMELSAREIEVARLAAVGWASGEIANELVVSVRTVENHVFNTYRKIGVESRSGLRRAFATWMKPSLWLGDDGPRPSR